MWRSFAATSGRCSPLQARAASSPAATYSHLWPTAEDRTRAAANDPMKQALGSLVVEVEDRAGDL